VPVLVQTDAGAAVGSLDVGGGAELDLLGERAGVEHVVLDEECVDRAGGREAVPLVLKAMRPAASVQSALAPVESPA
jgi:hypothetical protein